MKDITEDTIIEDDEIETPEIEEIETPKPKEVLTPKDNTLTLVLLVLVTLVVGFIVWYNNKQKAE